MRNLRLILFSLILSLVVTSTSFALGKDPRLAKITKAQLRVAAMEKPLDIERQSRLLSRASEWKLQADAYRLYKQRAAEEPNSANAHLLYAMSARLYAETGLFKKRGATGIDTYNSLLPEIRSQFQKAISLNPRSARISLSYGFWLWQFDGNMEKGLRLVENAHQLDPQDVGTLATLGSMYANPSGNCYDAKHAEQALNSAIRLDPNYASPRWSLVSLLYEQKRFAEAKRQLDAYIAVIPTNFATSPEILQWQKILNQK